MLKRNGCNLILGLQENRFNLHLNIDILKVFKYISTKVPLRYKNLEHSIRYNHNCDQNREKDNGDQIFTNSKTTNSEYYSVYKNQINTEGFLSIKRRKI